MSDQYSAIADPGPDEESKMSARSLDDAAASGSRGLVEVFVFEDAKLQSRLGAADGAPAPKAKAFSEASAPATLQEAALALMNV
jgi:hypothetical protein